MPETDLIWMSLVVFIPSAFAIGLLFFPRGWEEAMRWWSLFGTALTLGVSLCAFILFYNDIYILQNVHTDPANRSKTTLLVRASALDNAQVAHENQNSKDWLARYPWIP